MAGKRAKTTAKTPKAPEPFFRPFARLGAGAGAAKRPGKSVPAPVVEIEIEIAAAAPPALIDAHTFAIYMSGVRALPGRPARIPLTAGQLERVTASTSTQPLPDLDQGARAQLRSLVTDGVRFETTDDGERIEGRRLDVDPRELRRLRRVQYAIDGKLDLHGHGVDEARRAVETFVKKRAEFGDKVVAIVHGKGAHSPRQNGVLRGEIGAWLSQGRAARHVLAFATPPEDEGGAGAVLVLLAR